jgi:hypothetical protein
MKRKMRMAPRTYKIENRKGRNWTVTHRVEPARITMAERLRDHCVRHIDDLQAWVLYEKIQRASRGKYQNETFTQTMTRHLQEAKDNTRRELE